MDGAFTHVLKIEIDGHFHGAEAPRPWVAEILGPSLVYGLQREFLRPVHDWREARIACSGNVYGRFAKFLLRDGLYEASRTRGNSSKRRVVREFYRIVKGKRETIPPLQALAEACGAGAPIWLPEHPRSWAARIRGLGTPERVGFIVIDERRCFLLADGLYEISEKGERNFAIVSQGEIRSCTQKDALAYLSS